LGGDFYDPFDHHHPGAVFFYIDRKLSALDNGHRCGGLYAEVSGGIG
jgi:hypothetical protein